MMRVWPRLRWPPDSIGVRLTLWYTLWAVALIAAGSGLVYGGLETRLEREQDERVLGDHLRILAVLLQSSPDASSVPSTPRVGANSIPLGPSSQSAAAYVHVRVFGPSGQLLLATPGMDEHVPLPELGRLDSLHSERGELSENRSQSGRLFQVLSARIRTGSKPGDVRYVQIALDRTDDDLLDQMRDRSWLLMTFSVLACAAVGYTIAQRSIRPVENISRTVQQIHPHRLHERIDTRELPRELAVLAQTFNSMLDRLSRAFTSVSQFSDNAAHELRTPIANLQNELEVSLRKTRTSAEHREVVLSCLEECERIDRILQSLLFLARNSTPILVSVERIPLSGEVAALVDLYEPWASEIQVEIRVRVSDSSAVRADPVLLRQALANLFANALEHTSPGGHIELRSDELEFETRITVTDTGCGISNEDLPHVFDRFFRAEESRSGSRRHLGLGLSIVQSIMERHKGRAEIDSKVGEGTRIALYFPT